MSEPGLPPTDWLVWGTGATAQRLREALHPWRPRFHITRPAPPAGSRYLGVPVLGWPEAIPLLKPGSAIAICSSFLPDIARTLEEAGLRRDVNFFPADDEVQQNQTAFLNLKLLLFQAELGAERKTPGSALPKEGDAHV
jgi:hypothetical protein